MRTQEEIYNVNDIDKLLDESIPFVKSKKVQYVNVPFAFDIETTSFYRLDEKCNTMYAWVLGINGSTIIGRTWNDAITLFNRISEYYGLSPEKRVVVWVHNLSYEFQFIQHRFEWLKVFALESRQVIQAISTIGIEFRCSYVLSGYSLASVGKNLQHHNVQKMVGDLDYNLLRHTQTPLTPQELKYIQNDALVVMAYIDELIEQYGAITKLPLTKTGFVRNYCRNECLYVNGSHHKKSNYKYNDYVKQMQSMKITSVQEYEQLKRAFQGGFTHASALYSGIILDDITSYDFTSSYPSVMISELYPVTSGKLVQVRNKQEFEKYINEFCCIFDVCFENLYASTIVENPISESKCWGHSKIQTNNGRVVSADVLYTTITNVDYLIIKEFYKWDKMKVKNFRIYHKGYLPTNFVKSILKLYYDKTTLKGVEGSETEYIHAKENLNSCFGMGVTDILRPEIIYTSTGEWTEEQPDVVETLEKYNESYQRFLFYAWGIFVTAYARYNLFTGIKACGTDFVYADTDSIKIRNYDKHKRYFELYNENQKQKLLQAMAHHNLDETLVHPKTIKGVEKWLGFWDFDGHYTKFKTLGAKRYMYVYDDGHLDLTISGVNKRCAVPYLLDAYGSNDKVLDAFCEGLSIPREFTGKNIHTYIDYEQSGELTDYLGNKCEWAENGSVHMESSEYTLSMSLLYIEYLKGITDKWR